jgi:hypothetical protein
MPQVLHNFSLNPCFFLFLQNTYYNDWKYDLLNLLLLFLIFFLLLYYFVFHYYNKTLYLTKEVYLGLWF